MKSISENKENKISGRNKLILIFVILAFILFFLLYESYIKTKEKTIEFAEVIVNDIKIKVEIADTPEERTIGLMNRTYLGKDEGMLFIFENEDYHSFWMKDTLIPLEILFIDKELNIIQIVEMEPCTIKNQTCKIYSPNKPILYALELNANFSKINGIKIGDKIKIEK
ncbi:MAG: DUF192 domain-containing protein [Candidatus Micrarchaeia archaeon]